MNFQPKKELTDQDVKTGLRMVLGDALTTEAMTTLTGGIFLVAMALLMGASNFQIGLLAALPTLTNIFQLLSIWLVSRYNNRRAVVVVCTVLARIPLLLIGCLAVFLSTSSTIHFVIAFLFFYYMFGSIAGPSWNSWMKDLVPEKNLGTFFSKRSSYMQTLNVILSIALAFFVDYIKDNHPGYELTVYGSMFILGSLFGLSGAIALSRTPEPQSFLAKENIFKLLKKPLKDVNFRRLLTFNSAWVFAINIATPFFTVFMMKGLGLSISYIMALTIVSQLCSIFTVRIWGMFADRYSNKNIIAICGPLYILVIIAWCFVGIFSSFFANYGLLIIIHMFTGIATAGINLSLTNIGLKLATKQEAIVYLSAKNIITAFFSSIAPMIGGLLADYFTERHLKLTMEWGGPKLTKVLRIIELHEWNFLFLIGALLAFIAIELLVRVKEVGEVEKDVVVRIMRSSIKSNLKENFLIGNLITWHEQFWGVFKRKSNGTKIKKTTT